jgi:hypothetical protein
MTKAILEFDLNDRDDQAAHLRAVTALDLAIALFDIDNLLRAHEKYGAEPLDRDKFYEVMGKYNIDLDEILI